MRVTTRVLVRPEYEPHLKRARPRASRKLHDVHCQWAAGGNTGRYEERPRSDFPADWPVCGRCGGPGGIDAR
jgi:hypothetical protein